MDARALSAAAGVEVGTMNAWISRGHVPGVKPDAQGQRRNFDIKTASHIAIMAELQSFGFGAPLASFTAQLALDKFSRGQPSRLIVHPIQRGPVGEAGQKLGFIWEGYQSEQALTHDLNTLPHGRPDVYLTINTGQIFKRMEKAEDEWQQRRKGAGHIPLLLDPG